MRYKRLYRSRRRTVDPSGASDRGEDPKYLIVDLSRLIEFYDPTKSKVQRRNHLYQDPSFFRIVKSIGIQDLIKALTLQDPDRPGSILSEAWEYLEQVHEQMLQIVMEETALEMFDNLMEDLHTDLELALLHSAQQYCSTPILESYFLDDWVSPTVAVFRNRDQ